MRESGHFKQRIDIAVTSVEKGSFEASFEKQTRFKPDVLSPFAGPHPSPRRKSTRRRHERSKPR